MADRSIFRSSAVHVATGFVLMGAWALWANHAHGWDRAWPPALAQGTASAILTAFIKKTLEALNARLSGAPALIVPPVVTAASVLAILVAIHRLIGTPELVRTIAVPWSVSTLYAIIYNAGLTRRSTP